MITIVDRLEYIATTNAQKTAVHDQGRICSFRRLFECVQHEALRISDGLGGRKRRIIGVLLPKSIEAVIADLAILYSGNAYMNLDCTSPEARQRAILDQTRPDLLIIGPDADAPLFDIPALRIGDIASVPRLKDEDCLRAEQLREDLIDTDLACLINTSGSTGTPKAVALAHRGFIDFMAAVEAAGLMQDDAIIGSLSPTIFDIFSFELCMLAFKGSTLSLLPEKMAAFPVRLLQLMESTHVSFIFWVPTIMVNIANMRLLEKVPLPALKMVWFAGEVFPTDKFNYWRRCLPGVTFANFYGPIEITLDCLYFIVDREIPDDEPIPVGRPFKNTAILVLDEENTEVTPKQVGREGELCIRGSSLALGYYRNQERTAKAFVQNPLNTAYPEMIYRTGDIVAWNADGDLMFKGRKDTLIKRHGYRIELGEIEHAVVAGLKLADNCCALYSPETKKLLLVYESPVPQDEKLFSRRLSDMLPRYMLPNEYRHVVTMPRNTNGKIDRMALKRAFVTGEK